MLKHCVIRGKNIGYFDNGESQGQRGTLVFVHGSCGSHRMFTDLIEGLSSEYRILAPDLLGYGASESWPSNEPYHWQWDVDILLHLFSLSAQPVHIISYSYGAYLAMEASLQAPAAVHSLLLGEPAAFHLLQQHPNAQLWQETQKVAHLCAGAVAAGDLRRASSIYLKYWGSSLQWFFTPNSVKYSVQNKVHKVTKEFLSLETEGSELEEYRAIAQPTLLLSGEKSRASSREVVGLLSKVIKQHKHQAIANANHVTLFQKSKVLKSLVSSWLDDLAPKRSYTKTLEKVQPIAL